MYSHVDWTGDMNDRTSTFDYVLFLGANPISWSSKKQCTIARSSTEGEYHVVASMLEKTNLV